jgi:microcystin-dependent protein
MPGNVTINASSVPVGFCFTSWSESWPELVALISGTADLSVNLHIGDAAPADLTKAWLKTISGVPDRLYYFASGVWLAKHAIPVGFTMLAPAGTALADIDTLDGGEVGAVTAFTGPMWARDTDFDAMFPIGPGTLPSGTVLVEGATGGEEKHSLTVTEIPPHAHQLLVAQSNTGSGSEAQRLRPDSDLGDSDADSAQTGGDPSTLLVAPHNNMPVYRVRFFVKRTARTHYRG